MLPHFVLFFLAVRLLLSSSLHSTVYTALMSASVQVTILSNDCTRLFHFYFTYFQSVFNRFFFALSPFMHTHTQSSFAMATVIFCQLNAN